MPYTAARLRLLLPSLVALLIVLLLGAMLPAAAAAPRKTVSSPRVSATALMIRAAPARTDTAAAQSLNPTGRPGTSMVPAFVLMPPPLAVASVPRPSVERRWRGGIPEIRLDRGADRYVLAQDPVGSDGNFEASSVRERMPSLR